MVIARIVMWSVVVLLVMVLPYAMFCFIAQTDSHYNDTVAFVVLPLAHPLLIHIAYPKKHNLFLH